MCPGARGQDQTTVERTYSGGMLYQCTSTASNRYQCELLTKDADVDQLLMPTSCFLQASSWKTQLTRKETAKAAAIASSRRRGEARIITRIPGTCTSLYRYWYCTCTVPAWYSAAWKVTSYKLSVLSRKQKGLDDDVSLFLNSETRSNPSLCVHHVAICC